MVGRFIIGAVVVVMVSVWLAAIWLMFMHPQPGLKIGTL
jgi:hypothetical protein